MAGRKALVVFALLSLVSLFSDMTYEGARSVLGPYTRILEGSLLVAGGLMLGELVGQLARAASGGLAYRRPSPRLLWGMIVAGYIINLGAVPLLALAGNWREAYALAILERAGKGLRAPPRDVVLAEVGKGIGTHRAFALHEMADQIGAVAGPAVLALTASRSGIRHGLALLAVPAATAILLLLAAWSLYPSPRSAKPREERTAPEGLPPHARLAIAGAGLSLAALPAWPVLTYSMSPEHAAALYGLAMLVDAAAAPLAGEIGERLGLRALPLLPLLALLAGAMYWGSYGSPGMSPAMLLAAAVWGVYMGFYEVLARSSVPSLIGEGPARSLAYGLLGLASALGLALSGLLYSILVELAGRTGVLTAALLGAGISISLLRLSRR